MTVLVTGGGGFLGGEVVRQLLARGERVRSFARGAYPALEALGVEVRRGDLADAEAVRAAVRGCDTVVHVAAKAGVWGPRAAYREANVVGTRNVLDACRHHGVGRLVYTSTPSVVHAGRSIAGADESLPYATRFLAAYPGSKAVAERLVLSANGPGLATTALRPHLVWGPGDPHLLPGLLSRARSGRLRLIDGGQAVIDATYLDDAAEAHLAALDRLHDERSAPAGRAYFIASDQPRPVRELIDGLLRAVGAPPVRRSVPFAVAYAAGAAAEAVWGLLRRTDDPPMTRFLARQLATDHWFDLSAARRDLGYEPRVSVEEGLARLTAWVSGHQTAKRPPP